MGAPKIRRSLKETRRLQRDQHQRLAAGPLAYVTVIRHQGSGRVIGVLHDRGLYDKFKAKYEAGGGQDLHECELVDFPLTV